MRHFQLGQLQCYLCRALNIGLNQCPIGDHAFSTCELLDLAEYERRVVTSVGTLSFGQSYCLRNDFVHLFLRD